MAGGPTATVSGTLVTLVVGEAAAGVLAPRTVVEDDTTQVKGPREVAEVPRILPPDMRVLGLAALEEDNDDAMSVDLAHSFILAWRIPSKRQKYSRNYFPNRCQASCDVITNQWRPSQVSLWLVRSCQPTACPP